MVQKGTACHTGQLHEYNRTLAALSGGYPKTPQLIAQKAIAESLFSFATLMTSLHNKVH